MDGGKTETFSTENGRSRDCPVPCRSASGRGSGGHQGRNQARQAPWYERGNPRTGVPVPESFYHFIDKSKGKRYFELHQKGFSDPAKRDLCVTKDELIAFAEGRNEWTKLRSELEPELLRRLKSGELLARGINSTAPLDNGRQVIAPERWLDLCLSGRESSATGTSVYVTHILITRKTSMRSQAQAVVRVRANELRTWYKDRLAIYQARGQISTRDEDYEAAKKRFGKSVTRKAVRALRKELAPVEWTERGRRKGVRNRKGRDASDANDV